MSIFMRLRLSLMMFVNYFIWGSWYVTAGTYMKEGLGFSGVEVGAVYAGNAIAAILSPFFVGMVADRFFPTQRVLSAIHFLGAACMFAATQVTDFTAFYLLMLLYNLLFMPSLALTNSLAFRQMNDPEKEFPSVRVFGTLGWITVGLGVIGQLGWDPTVYPFYLAAGVSVLMGIYSLTLPHTPPPAKGEKIKIADVLGFGAWQLMKRRSFATVVIASVLICIPLAFYYNFANPFLNEIGFKNPAGRMTLGQASEALFLVVMPLLFARFGVKWILAIGMAAWTLRYALFAFGGVGSGEWMLFAGILLHGICYDFFFVSGQIYVDKEAPAHLKSSVQGMITLATYGVGMFIGSFVSGALVDQFAESESVHNWTAIWLFPAGFAAAVLLAFLISFRQKASSTPN